MPVPVVYVLFGAVPWYLLANIELASRTNPVILIGDVVPDRTKRIEGVVDVTLLSAKPFMASAAAFATRYVHMCGADSSPQRYLHELQNFQRWFVLKDFMLKTRTERVFFGDGDSAVFGNMTRAFALRSECDAVVNVEAQPNLFHWVAAGESSLWTVDALVGFTDFTLKMYSSASTLTILKSKEHHRPAVVDMSLLWLWFAKHYAALPPTTTTTTRNGTLSSWVAAWGKPLRVPDDGVRQVLASREKNVAAFDFAASLAPKLPAVLRPLRLCNGLDVFNRTVFDHMHGWTSGNFTLINKQDDEHFGLPFTYGARSMHGGRSDLAPGSPDPTTRRLFFLNLHYQGPQAKAQLTPDVCKVLLLLRPSTAAVIHNPAVADACRKSGVVPLR